MSEKEQAPPPEPPPVPPRQPLKLDPPDVDWVKKHKDQPDIETR